MIQLIIMNFQLEKVKQKYQKKHLKLEIKEEVISELLELTNYEEFGARRISKLVKEKIENRAMESLLDHKKKLVISTIKEETSSC